MGRKTQGIEMTNAWTLEDVRKVRQELGARRNDASTSRDETFHAQAAMVTSFVFDPRQHSGVAGANLKADSFGVSRTDPLRLALKDPVRRRILKKLQTKDALRQTLEATANRPTDPVQLMLEAWLNGTADALADQTPEQLSATLQVVDWFSETELASSLPAVAEVRGLVDHASLLSPLRALAGSHFHGRTTELAAIESYVGEYDASSLRVRPPLLIYGPGGMGKSSLVAKFILENSALPFVYLDCDRPGLIAMEPVTLLAEAVRQIGIQFPHFAFPAERLRERWLGELTRVFAPGAGAQAATTLGRATFMREFQLLVTDLQLADRKILLVLDSFEEVQYRSQAVVGEIFQFLDELQELMPYLRAVVVGRNPVPGFNWDPLEIGELDDKAAQAFLGMLGIESVTVRKALARLLRGNPLSLRLAAALSQLNDQSGFDQIQSLASDIEIQGVLYGRILGHVRTDDVRQLAHPGLILRRITSDIIRQVLAEPCGLQSVDEARALELFELLRNELSLVVPEGNAVRHRADVRSVMLRPLKAEQREKVRQIEEAAVRYYFPYDDATSRAEEIYHRLSLMQPRSEIDDRWLPGIEDILRPAVDELDGTSRTFLAARLGIELYDGDWDNADLTSWERFAIKRTQTLLDLDKPLEAIRLLRRRSERLPDSPLHWTLAQALRRSGQNREARQVARKGIASLLGDSQWGEQELSNMALEAARASPVIQTINWFAGPDLSHPPSTEEIRIRLERSRVQHPLHILATRTFAGRQAESHALESYVFSTSTRVRPPLLICGPGGIGKSALVAHFALQHQRRLAQIYLTRKSFDSALDQILPSIVAEAAYQLDLQFPGLDPSVLPVPRSVWTEGKLLDALASVTSLTSDASPLLFVLDNADELAARSSAATEEIYSFLMRLQRVVPRLRPVLIARGRIPDIECEILEIGNLDMESAQAFLAAEGIASTTLRGGILRLTQANPLAMRIAVDLVRQQGEAALGELVDSHATDGTTTAELLLGRILQHVADPDLRRVVDAALVLRRITPQVLRDVVSVVAGVTIGSDENVEEFYEKLKSEVAFFVLDGDVLRPRPDIRRLIQRSRPAAALQGIHTAAVDYYASQDDLRGRAEEVYHRLALGQSIDKIDSRWLDGIETSLKRAVDDFSGPARAYLEAKLGTDPDTLDWLEADEASWESYVATRARDLLNRGAPREALELLRKRSTRTPRSDLFSIEATALIDIGQPREAMSVAHAGLQLWPGDPLLPALLAKCEASLGIEETAPTLTRPNVSPRADARYHLPQDIDLDALAKVLDITLPTKTDIVNAWSGLLDHSRLPSGPTDEIVRAAATAGLLDELVSAAYDYASQPEMLQRFLQDSGARLSSFSPNRHKSQFGPGRLVINRYFLRQFLADLSQDSARNWVLLVRGPRHSGKTFTIRIARWMVGHLMRIAVINVGSLARATDVARELCTLLGWRLELPIDDTGAQARNVMRYADMIHARAQHDGTRSLVIFEYDGESTMAPDVRDFMTRLAIDPPRELCFIFIGFDVSVFSPMTMPYLMIEELGRFNEHDLVEGLREALGGRDVSLVSLNEAAQAALSLAKVDEHNRSVGETARRILDGLDHKFPLEP